MVDDGAKFCPNCGAPADSSGNRTYNSDYNSNYNNSYTNNTAGENGKNRSGLKTAAAVGGTVLGVSALGGLVRSMTHRRRPPYMGMGGMGQPPMGPPPGGMGGMGGHGGMGGPGRMM